MNVTELAEPNNQADCIIKLDISGNRLVSLLNAFDSAMHATGRYRFEGNDVVPVSEWYADLRATIEAIRDELSRQRQAART
jgi:hypothetical protein